MPPAPSEPRISYEMIRATIGRGMGSDVYLLRLARGPTPAPRLVSLRSLAGPQAPPPAPSAPRISYELIRAPIGRGMGSDVYFLRWRGAPPPRRGSSRSARS